VQDHHLVEPLGTQAAAWTVEPRSQPTEMPLNDDLVDHPARSRRVPCDDHGRSQVQHEGQAWDAGRLGSGQQCTASPALHVGRIDDGQEAVLKPPLQLAMQASECRIGDVLVCLVARDQRPHGIRRQDLGRPEMTCRERALAAASRPDQDHQAWVGDDDLGHAARDVPSPAHPVASGEGSVVCAVICAVV